MKKKKNEQYKIIYDHPEFVVVNKPAGLLSVPERFTNEISLKRLLKDKYGEIYAVHRLDQFTSGLILYAKNTESHRIFNRMFEERSVVRKYRAIATGKFYEDHGIIDLPIMRLPGKNQVLIHKKGKPSQTKYQVLEQTNHYALVDLELLTGRTHQIRVHLMASGHPLMVDPAYGGEEEFFVSRIKGQNRFHLEKGTSEYPLLTRPPLHAYYLAFTNPYDEKEEAFETEMPKDMRAVLHQIQKWDK